MKKLAEKLLIPFFYPGPPLALHLYILSFCLVFKNCHFPKNNVKMSVKSKEERKGNGTKKTGSIIRGEGDYY